FLQEVLNGSLVSSYTSRQGSFSLNGPIYSLTHMLQRDQLQVQKVCFSINVKNA
ncbi:hypothetical protein L9F63_014167, partial [Diploptera punctata]